MKKRITQTSISLTLSAAEQLTELAIAEATRQAAVICVAVVDCAGHLLSFRRMDGAALISIDVAIGKARTTAFLKMPAGVFEEMINAGNPSMLSVPGAVPLAGGQPVVLEGAVIGAVGISGSSSPGDEAIALASVDAFGRSLQ